MDNFIRLLGDRVRKLRKAQGLSQEKLGEKAGFDYRYIGFIEQARVNPTIKTLEKVADALNVHLCDLCPSKEELIKNKKGVPPQITEREKILSKMMRHLNKVDNAKLKSIEKIVKISVENEL
jgi:transcriptional regulator with XRE-family HTH domain